jgi:nucleotide-binding universal stress UspA family protein
MILLNDYEQKFTEKGLNVKNKIVLSGNPAHEIIKFITKEDIDLVVCGIRDRKHLSKFLLNSVSKRILESAKSDVMIVRP